MSEKNKVFTRHIYEISKADMDNDEFHNANIQNLTFGDETLKNKLKNKVLQNEFEKLNLEKEVMRLGFENENLKKEVKSLKAEKDSGKLEEKNEKLEFDNESLRKEIHNSKNDFWKLEEEIKKLKKEVSDLKTDGENLKTENQRMKNEIQRLEKKHLATVKSEATKISKLVPMKERLIEQGVWRFIEGIESETKVYDSYVQWYDDVSERMIRGNPYEYDKYLFVRQTFKQPEKGKKIALSYRSYRTDSTMVNVGFQTKTLDRGWTNENIKMVFVLNPKDPQKFYELKYMEKYNKDQVDADGKLIYHRWKLNDGEYARSRILCCIKK